MAWKECNHRDLHIRDVREGFNGQGFERDETTRNEQRHQQQQKQGLVERKRDNPFDHAHPSVLRLEEGIEE
jgi:hypothetical protein